MVSSPVDGDMTVASFENSNLVGFSAKAFVAGDYLVRGTLTPTLASSQSFSVVIPIRVFDPMEIDIRFSPENPDAGELVTVQFKVTDDLCRLYTFCIGLNRLICPIQLQ